MTEKQLWNALLKKSPELKGSGAKVTITPDNLKKLMSRAYEEGWKESLRANSKGDPLDDMFSTFGDLFK